VHNLPNEDAEHEEITRKRKLSRGEEPARLLQETDFVNPSIFLFSNVFSFLFFCSFLTRSPRHRVLKGGEGGWGDFVLNCMYKTTF